VLGRDGTAKSWNKRSKSAGAAHIKTGTLSNARSTVGVVHNPAGDIIFVFLAETRGTALARRAIQELLEWSYKLPRPTTTS
jgi:D-alanyl-D-alanine carboxypeptidase